MSIKTKVPGQEQPINPRCLLTRDVPAVCLRLQSHRQRIALPYALLLRVELSEDETTCAIIFATHEVSVQGRHLEQVYLAVSQGQAVQIAIGQSEGIPEGTIVLGPLVTKVRIEPIGESDRARR
ncbi:MAG: hypothetical protein JNG82_12995 [Opitutaceae bacterium]|nr:hypothetical protein [Opitutaceae bacterium]